MTMWTNRAKATSAALLVVWGACSQEVVPATQIVVSIDSDLVPGVQLTEVSVEILKGDGDENGRTVLPAIPVAKDANDAAKNRKVQLPLTLPILPGAERQVMIRVSGAGVHGSNSAIRELITQRAVVSFTDRKTQLVRMYLGKVCIDEDCKGQADQVCYPTALAGVAAGACGSVQTWSANRTVSSIAPEQIPTLLNAPNGDGLTPDMPDSESEGDDRGTASTDGLDTPADAGTRRPSTPTTPGTGGTAGDAGSRKRDAGTASSDEDEDADAGSCKQAETEACMGGAARMQEQCLKSCPSSSSPDLCRKTCELRAFGAAVPCLCGPVSQTTVSKSK